MNYKESVKLSVVRNKTQVGDPETMRDGSVYKFEKVHNLLYRTCTESKFKNRVGRSLVIQTDCRKIILNVTHESPLIGHFSHRKTKARVHWLVMTADIQDFCNSCDKFQRMLYKGRVKPVSLKPTPILNEPFSRVAIDIVVYTII